jgi:hypothetical protein
MAEEFAAFLERVYGACVAEYDAIVRRNPNIDAGHSVNHVITVENWTFRGLAQLLNDKSLRLEEWADTYNGCDRSCLQVAKDAVLRVMVASLFHEIGDGKFADGKVDKPKKQLIFEALTRVFDDTDICTDEFKTDIYNMIEYCGASTWGNRIPPNVRIYQLIPRWADRLEATGVIGLARTMTFSYSKRKTGYPICRDEDEFPTSLAELEQMAPESRWERYSTMNQRSISGLAHLLDKIKHICGKDVPIPVLRDALNEGQRIVKQFIIDFTVVNGKKFDIDWIVNRLDPKIYTVEIAQLLEMQTVLPQEGCKWIKTN